MKGILEEVSRIDERTQAIAESAREQSLSLKEFNTAVAETDRITQQMAAMMEETSAAGHSLRDDAESLVGLARRFKVGTDERVSFAQGKLA